MNTKTQTYIHKKPAVMQKLLLSIFFIGVCASQAFAQTSTDYNKVEFYGGYLYNRVQPNVKSFTAFGSTLAPCSSEATNVLGKNFQTYFCQRHGFNGFDTSITYNVNRYFGIKANVTRHSTTIPFVDTPDGTPETNTVTEHIYNFLGGVQVKDNSKTARFKPFAHALVGAARNARSEANTSPIPLDNFTNRSKVTSFAMKLGGGIDVRVHRRVDLRLVEVDYNPIFTRDYIVSGNPFGVINTNAKRANNFTIGFGVTFH